MPDLDYLSTLIEQLLQMIGYSTFIGSRDGRYTVSLKAVGDSTISGRTYEIEITDKKFFENQFKGS